MVGKGLPNSTFFGFQITISIQEAQKEIESVKQATDIEQMKANKRQEREEAVEKIPEAMEELQKKLEANAEANLKTQRTRIQLTQLEVRK